MYIVRKYHEQIDRFICAGSRGAFIRALALLVIVLGMLGALVFRFGAPAMNGRPWDTPTILDGAWRIANGQVPHRDYYNYLGDLPFYLTSLGMKLGRPSMAAIDYGNVVLMAALVLPAMAVLRRRASALHAFLFSLFIGLLVITPRPLGDPYDYTDHAMLYNRYGEAFMALFGAIVLLPPRPDFAKSRMDWAESVLAGFVLVALLGCKLNYFAVGIVFFGVACLTGRFSIGRALLCMISALAFLAIALALSRIPLSELMNDYRMMSASQSPGSRFHGLVIQGLKSFYLLPVLLLPVWEGFLAKGDQADQRQPPWRHILVIVVIFGGAALLLSSNCQIGEMPLLALAALYGAELIQRQAGAAAETAFFVTARHLGALLLVLLFLVPPILEDLKTIRFATFAAVKKNWDSTATLQSTRLNDFRFIREGTRRAEMQSYMESLDEGIQLLRRHADPKMHLNAILFSDPFHVALGWIPASGGIISLSTDGLVRASHPPLARMLGNATHLLTDRGCQTLKQAYGAEWDALNLEVVEETKHYALYKIPESRVGQLEQAHMAGKRR